MDGFYYFHNGLEDHIIALHIALNNQPSNCCTFLFHSTLPLRFLASSFRRFILCFHCLPSSTSSCALVGVD